VVTSAQRDFLRASRVARLATVGADGRPHVMPVVFALDGNEVVVPLDAKPKRVDPRRLRRVRNVEETGRACLLVDRWSEDWSQLAWLMLECRAAVTEVSPRELDLLRARYPQYARVAVAGIIRLAPDHVVGWAAQGSGGSRT